MSRGWNIALWVLQVLLAVAFFGSGALKLTAPIDELVKAGMTWAGERPWLPRFIGASEALGALGLVLPAATRVAPKLTPLAAASLALVMLLAVLTHLATDGPGRAVPALVLGSLSALVAFGRLQKAPIAPR